MSARTPVPPLATRNQTRKRTAEAAAIATQESLSQGPRRRTKEVLPPVHPDNVIIYFHGALDDSTTVLPTRKSGKRPWSLTYEDILGIIDLTEKFITPQTPYAPDSRLITCAVHTGPVPPRQLSRFDDQTDWEILISEWKSKSTWQGNGHAIHFVCTWKSLPPVFRPPPTPEMPSPVPASLSLPETRLDLQDLPFIGSQVPRSSITTRRECQISSQTYAEAGIRQQLRAMHTCNKCSTQRGQFCYEIPWIKEHVTFGPLSVNEWVKCIANKTAVMHKPPDHLPEYKAYWKRHSEKEKQSHMTPSVSPIAFQPSPTPFGFLPGAYGPPYSQQSMSLQSAPYSASANSVEEATAGPMSSPPPQAAPERPILRSWLTWTIEKSENLGNIDVDEVLNNLHAENHSYASLKDTLANFRLPSGRLDNEKVRTDLWPLGIRYGFARELYHRRKAWHAWYDSTGGEEDAEFE